MGEASLPAALRTGAPDVVVPRYGDGGIGAVLPGVLDALRRGGLAVPAAPAGADPAPAAPDVVTPAGIAALGLPATRRACVVLVDGLGWELLGERAGHAPYLRRLLPGARALTSTYPSTTAAALGTFGTGRAPGRTGMLGYQVRVPDQDGTPAHLANLVSWEGAPEPERWQREPPLLEAATAAGLRVSSVGPARFEGSGMTRAALRGARYVPAESLDDRVAAAARTLREPGLTYLYWGDVDKVGHHEGWRSAAWETELERLDGGLAALARSVPAGTLLVVTADHGMVDVDTDAQLDVGVEPALLEGVVVTAGEPRALHVHVASDVDPADVAARWSERLGDRARVGLRQDVVDAGLFGPVAPHVLPVIGDVVVATRGRATVVDSRTQTVASILLRGVHGSLTPGEMLVPFVTDLT